MSDAVRRTSAEIREDIGRTRVGLDFLIDALEGRLSMGSLVDEAVGILRGRGTGDPPLGTLIRDHPGPAALITAGVVWLAIENRKGADDRAESRSKRGGSKRSSGGRKSGGSKSGARKSSGSKSGGRKSSARKKGGGES